MDGHALEVDKEHRLGENHGYVLTSASEREFADLGSIGWRKALLPAAIGVDGSE
jgi:hypothetical protein